MKPCQLCRAAVPDDVSLTPETIFCGACGRSAEDVRRTPTLPPGALPYLDPVSGMNIGTGQWPPGMPPGTAQPPWAGMPGSASAAGTVPQGLNWGAFVLPFLWGPANNTWIGLLALIGLIPLGITQLVSFGVSIYLLIKGNELAWHGGRAWQSEQQFQAVQKSWMVWGLASGGVIIVLSLLSLLTYGAMSTAGSAPYVPSQ